MDLCATSPSALCKTSSDALGAYGVLDTPHEERFDRIARLAAKIMGAPTAMVNLADTDRIWVKAQHGIDIAEAPSEFAFCPHALALDRALVIEDTAKDPRFVANPYVIDAPHIRFYAGAQLRNPEGIALGTLCVLDSEPHKPTPEQVEALEDLAQSVVAELELRRTTLRLRGELEAHKRLSAELEASRQEAEESRTWLEDFMSSTSDVLWETDVELRLYRGRGSEALLTEMDHMVGKSLYDLAEAAGGPEAVERMKAQVQARKSFRQLEFTLHLPGGRVLWLEASGKPVIGRDGVFKRYRGLLRDITARKLDDAQVRREADEDPLTGLPNRRVFERRLSEAVVSHTPGALLLLDIDHFKSVNDTHGHEVGDLLVRGVGKRIAEQVRAGDTVARIGGDEFAVILRGAPEDQVRNVAARICAAVEVPFVFDDKVLYTSLSVGAALTGEVREPDAVVRLADHALYASKHAGRARWTMYGDAA